MRAGIALTLSNQSAIAALIPLDYKGQVIQYTTSICEIFSPGASGDY